MIDAGTQVKVTYPDGEEVIGVVDNGNDKGTLKGWVIYQTENYNVGDIFTATEGTDKIESLEGSFPHGFSADNLVRQESLYKMKEALLNITSNYTPEVGAKIADAYEQMQHNPNDPEVIKSYQEFAKEVNQQYNSLPVKVEFTPQNPYKTSQEMFQDIDQNKRLKIYKSGTPESGINPMIGNDLTNKFRAVHDYYGHYVNRNSFNAQGEYQAWVDHSKMFSPLAQKAMTTETLGQNSWFNYSKVNQGKPNNQRQYAEQKAGILPEEYMPWNLNKTGSLEEIKKKRNKRPKKFKSTKDDIINDIREVVTELGGEIKWANPEIIWNTDGFIGTDGTFTTWTAFNEKTLKDHFVPQMNSLFIYGVGANTKTSAWYDTKYKPKEYTPDQLQKMYPDSDVFKLLIKWDEQMNEAEKHEYRNSFSEFVRLNSNVIVNRPNIMASTSLKEITASLKEFIKVSDVKDWAFSKHKPQWKYNKITSIIEKDDDAITRLGMRLKKVLASEKSYIPRKEFGDEDKEYGVRCPVCNSKTYIDTNGWSRCGKCGWKEFEKPSEQTKQAGVFEEMGEYFKPQSKIPEDFRYKEFPLSGKLIYQNHEWWIVPMVEGHTLALGVADEYQLPNELVEKWKLDDLLEDDYSNIKAGLKSIISHTVDPITTNKIIKTFENGKQTFEEYLNTDNPQKLKLLFDMLNEILPIVKNEYEKCQSEVGNG